MAGGGEAFRAMQHRIRTDAMEQSAALSSLKDWKASIAAKDAALRQATPASQPSTTSAGPGVRGGDTVPAKSIVAGPTGDAHTYDKGYSKWESFDVDAALATSEDDGSDAVPVSSGASALVSPADVGSSADSPAAPVVRSVRKTVLKSGIGNERLDPAEVERLRGNERFRAGNFSRAVEAYTRSLGYRPNQHLVQSNRAEAHLRLKEFTRALEDASEALQLCPGHVKSLVRRGRAAVGLGRYRDALVDLAAALRVDPGNKTAAAELGKAKEMRRAALQRAPRAPLGALLDIGGEGAAPMTVQVGLSG